MKFEIFDNFQRQVLKLYEHFCQISKYNVLILIKDQNVCKLSNIRKQFWAPALQVLFGVSSASGYL